MNYPLIHGVLELVEAFESVPGKQGYTRDLEGFKHWIHSDQHKSGSSAEPDWEGKTNGRSAESVISTLLVHMNRYAKLYSKAAIHGSGFSTQEEFIYLISLRSFGAMTKMELINRNIQDKPTGMQIINRLIKNGWVVQTDSNTDRRSKVIKLTVKGLKSLERQMGRIRMATRIVTGNLSYEEKMELIRLLNKLNDFHHPIFSQHWESGELLQKVNENYLQA